MQKTFMCDIITREKEDIAHLRQVLIKATTLNDAFEKFKTVKNYPNLDVYEERNGILFAHIMKEGDRLPILYVLIGEPSDIIE